MELLFKREQTAGKVGRVKFRLWGKIELDENETAVVSHYSFDDAVLIDSWQPELIRKSIFIAIGVFVLTVSMFWSSMGFGGALFIGVMFGGGAGYFYYDYNRETIFVKDLMHGRYFSCGSVVELARKEAWLETATAFLRQVMESAKHWDGTERRPVEVLPKDEAKRVILRGF